MKCVTDSNILQLKIDRRVIKTVEESTKELFILHLRNWKRNNIS